MISISGQAGEVHELARYGQSVDLLVIGGHEYQRIDHLLLHPVGEVAAVGDVSETAPAV